MTCLLGKALAGSSENDQEIVQMILDDRDGYSGGDLTRALTAVVGVNLSLSTAEEHRAGDCSCPPKVDIPRPSA